jgi:hypothetical protein
MEKIIIKYLSSDVIKKIIQDPELSRSDVRALCATSKEFDDFCRKNQKFIQDVITNKSPYYRFCIPVLDENGDKVEYSYDVRFIPELYMFDIEHIVSLTEKEDCHYMLEVYEDEVKRGQIVFVVATMLREFVTYRAFKTKEDAVEDAIGTIFHEAETIETIQRSDDVLYQASWDDRNIYKYNTFDRGRYDMKEYIEENNTYLMYYPHETIKITIFTLKI